MPRFEIVVWLALGAVPLAVAPGAFVAYDLTPKLLLAGTAACLSLAWIAYWLPGLAILARTLRGRIYLAAAASVAISLTASTFASAHLDLSLAGTTWRRYGLVTQLAILIIGIACAGYFAQHPARIEAGLRPLLIAGGITSLIGIGQYFGYDFLFDPKLYSTDYLHLIRPPATLGHAMYFSVFLLPAVFLAGARRMSALASILIILAIAAIILSGTRAALLGFVAGAAIFTLRERNRIGRRRLMMAAGIFAMLAAGFIALFFASPGQAFRGRIEQWKEDARGGPRLFVWRESLDLLQHHFLLGAGPETFAQDFRKIESPAIERAYPDFYIESPHNMLLETVIAQGIPGLLALLAIFGAVLFPASGGPLSSGLMSGLVAMLVALQFMPVTIANALCLFIIAGMLIGQSHPQPAAAAAPLRWARPVAALAIPLVASAILLFAIDDWFFARAGDAIHRGDLDTAAALYRNARALPFPHAGEDLWLSRQFASARAIGDASDASDHAERTAEDPFNAFYQSAALAFASGEVTRGEQKLARAIELAPAWYKPHLLLAESLLMRGSISEGLAEARRASDLSGAAHQAVDRTIQTILDTQGRRTE